MAVEKVGDVLTQAIANKWKFRVCGAGATDNNLNRPKGIMCTDLNLVASDKCLKAGTTEALDVPENMGCLQWPDRENNL